MVVGEAVVNEKGKHSHERMNPFGTTRSIVPLSRDEPCRTLDVSCIGSQ